MLDLSIHSKKGKTWLIIGEVSLFLALIGGTFTTAFFQANGIKEKRFYSENTDGLIFTRREDENYSVKMDPDFLGTRIHIENSYQGVNITAIDDDAFFNLSQVKEITFGDKIASIGENAFVGTAFYTKSNTDNNQLIVNNWLIRDFHDDTSDILIPEGTIGIASGAFDSITDQDISLPSSVLYLPSGSLTFSSPVTNITFNTQPKTFSTDSFSSSGTVSYFAPWELYLTLYRDYEWLTPLRALAPEGYAALHFVTDSEQPIRDILVIPNQDKFEDVSKKITKNGYSFQGWSLEESSSTLAAGYVTESVDLFPVFSLKIFTCTFATDRYSSSSWNDGLTHSFSIESVIPNPNMKDANHTFDGWYLDKCGQNPFDYSQNTSQLKTLYAVSRRIPDGYKVITNVIELKNINNDMGGWYILGNNISLNYANWTPLGGYYSCVPFTGIFDGNGYAITGLRFEGVIPNYSAISHLGLFGVIGDGGIVRNLYIKSVTYKTTGANYDHGNAREYIGSIAGACAGTIEYCGMSSFWVEAKEMNFLNLGIAGTNFVGGLCGVLAGGTLDHCEALGNSLYTGRGSVFIGGFAGLSGATTIGPSSVTNCVFSGICHSYGTTLGGVSYASGLTAYICTKNGETTYSNNDINVAVSAKHTNEKEAAGSGNDWALDLVNSLTK